MMSNYEIFLNFLADNFSLGKYTIAYNKRYNLCYNPFYVKIANKAEKNPKGLFSEILGSGHSFKKLEKKWIEYIDDTINYTPQKGDMVYCCYLDEETCTKVCWITDFLEGTKECFTDGGGTVNDKQTFVRKVNLK